MSLQSHAEVLNALDEFPSIVLKSGQKHGVCADFIKEETAGRTDGKIFVASISPQVRASLAATYDTTEKEAGWMIEQLLSGQNGLGSGGRHGSSFQWVVDTNAMREASLVIGAEEVIDCLSSPAEDKPPSEGGAYTTRPRKPVLSSACPGWICYAEKTHPHVLAHLSRLKSPQALTGTLLKTILSKQVGVDPSRIWHLAIMPCFDKKLEASREELTDIYWKASHDTASSQTTRDVDCVITARELLMLAETRGLSFPSLPRKPPLNSTDPSFPDSKLNKFLFPNSQRYQVSRRYNTPTQAGSSGGYLYHIMRTYQARQPGSTIRIERGRNSDVVEYFLEKDTRILFRAARYYGFRNIQNLVRRLKPMKKSRLPGGKMVGMRKPSSKSSTQAGGISGKSRSDEEAAEYSYVEVMACPGGCTNGGGQIKVDDIGSLQGTDAAAKSSQKEWLARVDEAYFSMDDQDSLASPSTGFDEKDDYEDVKMEYGSDSDVVNGISPSHIHQILDHWSETTGIDLKKLVFTSYRKVESDVGKDNERDTDRVVELAGKLGGGW